MAAAFICAPSPPETAVGGSRGGLKTHLACPLLAGFPTMPQVLDGYPQGEPRGNVVIPTNRFKRMPPPTPFLPASVLDPVRPPERQHAMKHRIITRNQRREFCPLPFRSFLAPGYCFARVDVHDGMFTILCSQLPGYNGTPVSSAMEEVLDSLVTHLLENGANGEAPALEVMHRFKRVRRLLTPFRSMRAKDRAQAKSYIRQHCQWIEHFPARTHPTLDHERLALLRMCDEGVRSASYLPREALERLLPDPAFLIVPAETTAKWKSALPLLS